MELINAKLGRLAMDKNTVTTMHREWDIIGHQHLYVIRYNGAPYCDTFFKTSAKKILRKFTGKRYKKLVSDWKTRKKS
jgi:hypothetical protein